MEFLDGFFSRKTGLFGGLKARVALAAEPVLLAAR